MVYDNEKSVPRLLAEAWPGVPTRVWLPLRVRRPDSALRGRRVFTLPPSFARYTKYHPSLPPSCTSFFPPSILRKNKSYKQTNKQTNKQTKKPRKKQTNKALRAIKKELEESNQQRIERKKQTNKQRKTSSGFPSPARQLRARRHHVHWGCRGGKASVFASA